MPNQEADHHYCAHLGPPVQYSGTPEGGAVAWQVGVQVVWQLCLEVAGDLAVHSSGRPVYTSPTARFALETTLSCSNRAHG